jgi:hypothetical protein
MLRIVLELRDVPEAEAENETSSTDNRQSQREFAAIAHVPERECTESSNAYHHKPIPRDNVKD